MQWSDTIMGRGADLQFVANWYSSVWGVFDVGAAILALLILMFAYRRVRKLLNR